MLPLRDSCRYEAQEYWKVEQEVICLPFVTYLSVLVCSFFSCRIPNLLLVLTRNAAIALRRKIPWSVVLVAIIWGNLVNILKL